MKLVQKLLPRKVRKKIKALLGMDAAPIAVTVPYEIKIVDAEKLRGQVAIVTGGSGAIGRAICCQLAAEGAIVYVCGTTESKTASVASEISSFGGVAHPWKMNISSEEEIVKSISDIHARHGRIDIFVNCAGGSAREQYSPLIHQKTSVIDAILDINLRGAILCTREAARVMVDRGYGRIINISSIIGERGKANFAEYAATKGGIVAFTKSFAMEVGKSGITVNCVSPGIVQRGVISESDLQRIRSTNWLNRHGKPEDIGTTVSFLVSDAAAFITGQNIMVDGGRSLGLKGD